MYSYTVNCKHLQVFNKMIVILFIDLGTGKGEEEEEVKVWEDNWDDDNIEDDFSVQLKWVFLQSIKG